MSSRRIKQFLYGFIYLILWAAVITAIYFLFFKPAPSCFDGIQNEGEMGIDCGGPCAKTCVPSDIQAITTIGNVNVFTPLPGHVSLLTQVANSNADFAADNFDYTFNLYDASGNLLQSLPGTSFIYADQTKYLAVPNEAVSGVVVSADIVISNPHWVPASTIGAVPQFSFQDLAAVSVSTTTLAVNGQLTDNDSSAFSDIEVVAILKSTTGIPAGVSETEIDSVNPNQSQNFSIMYPALSNIDPSQTQVYAYALR